MLPNEMFYDSLSNYYDEMISFDELLERKTVLLKNILNAGDARRAADLGCGTGVDSIALTRLGYRVTGFDISKNMLQRAKKNAERIKADVDFVTGSVTDISNDYYGKFDIILSLGNSLANLNPQQLESTLQKVRNLLAPDGRILIQILNYALLLESRERIINITENEKYHYVRFYDFEKEKLGFNILKYTKENLKDYSLISTAIYPHTYFTFDRLLRSNGFKNIKYFGGLNKITFNEKASKDLVITAE